MSFTQVYPTLHIGSLTCKVDVIVHEEFTPNYDTAGRERVSEPRQWMTIRPAKGHEDTLLKLLIGAATYTRFIDELSTKKKLFVRWQTTKDIQITIPITGFMSTDMTWMEGEVLASFSEMEKEHIPHPTFGKRFPAFLVVGARKEPITASIIERQDQYSPAEAVGELCPPPDQEPGPLFQWLMGTLGRQLDAVSVNIPHPRGTQYAPILRVEETDFRKNSLIVRYIGEDVRFHRD